MAGAQTRPAGAPADYRNQRALWEDTAAKDTAMSDWCARIAQQTGQRWEDTRVNQSTFEAHKPHTLVEAIQLSD
jgi:hypothetical protein